MNRYDFIFIFDVKDANPNGDPDAGNLPRIDPETGHGLVTDVCIKRKIRNYIGLKYDNKPPKEIYVKEGEILNRTNKRAYEHVKLEPSNKLPKDIKKARELTLFMCSNFFDIRTFGAVMSHEVNCGQVRGPVQISFARSIEPIVTLEHALTICAARKENKPIIEQVGIQGRKFTVPYAVYSAYGFINPFLAEKTGFNEDDLELLWESLENAFQFDQSAARPAGSMTSRKLIIFKHENSLGSESSHRLFDLVKIERTNGSEMPARNFIDYNISVNNEGVPVGVELIERL